MALQTYQMGAEDCAFCGVQCSLLNSIHSTEKHQLVRKPCKTDILIHNDRRIRVSLLSETVYL